MTDLHAECDNLHQEIAQIHDSVLWDVSILKELDAENDELKNECERLEEKNVRRQTELIVALGDAISAHNDRLQAVERRDNVLKELEGFSVLKRSAEQHVKRSEPRDKKPVD